MKVYLRGLVKIAKYRESSDMKFAEKRRKTISKSRWEIVEFPDHLS